MANPPGVFTTYRNGALAAPIAGPNGRAWSNALGSAQDDELILMRVAGACRSTVKAPDDALDPVLGSIYNRARSPREQGPVGIISTETGNDAFRRRLSGAFAFWESAPHMGPPDPNHRGISSLFYPYAQDYFDPGPAVVVNSYDAGIAWSSEFVIVWPSLLFPDDPWDAPNPGVWDDGGLWDVKYDPANPYTAPSFGVADLDWLRRQIRLSKAATAYPVTVAVGLGFDTANQSPWWDDGTVWDLDDIGALWDTDDAAYTYFPLGAVWEQEEILYGGGAFSAWDAVPDTWDEDAFYPPQGGWP